jgi:two-component system, sensor histidine kinase PdtaS
MKKSERLQIQYETNLKEGEIKIKDQNIKLLSQKNQIQQASLTRETVVKNVTLGGIIILFVAAGVTYIQYRRKLKLNWIITGQNQLITEKNAMLEHLLVEKDWLLKEVHHRVKNNLHTVICLLELQAASLENDSLKAIENGQHRIYAMSLIHQKLYQSDDIKTIDMSAYIPELVQSLQESFDTSNQIKFKLNIDPINLTLSNAVPFGLIINEAVTNSIKYAFPGDRKGEISISMIEDGEQIKLELADNGIGMTLNNYETGQGSLGLRLMKGLSEDIKADISFEVDNGTKVLIIFKRDAMSDQESFLNVPVKVYLRKWE